eukprot:jgi/Psemu1/295305/fgenesh1_pm.58_\
MGDGTIHQGEHGLQVEILEQTLQYSSLFGSLVLVFGIATAVLNFGILLVQHVTGSRFNIQIAITQTRGSPLTLDRTKLELARMVSFSLLLLVAADVLETLLKPGHEYEMEELYKIAWIGGIRTTLAYFLGKETEEIMHHIEHSEEHGEHNQEEEIGSHGNNDQATKAVAIPEPEASSRPQNARKKKRKQKNN